MGSAVCYQSKPPTLTKDDVLKALADKSISETIGEGAASEKSQQLQKQRLSTHDVNSGHTKSSTTNTVGAIEAGSSPGKTELDPVPGILNMDQVATNGGVSSSNTHSSFFKLNQSEQNPEKHFHRTISSEVQSDLHIKILSYFGTRDTVYDTLSSLSRDSLIFMRRNHAKLERRIVSHSNERARIAVHKTIEEHQSGVNQIIKLSSKEILTASDDCYLKYWSLIVPSSNPSLPNMKLELSISVETITCLAMTGGLTSISAQKREYLVVGCHSGALHVINSNSLKPGANAKNMKREYISQAHSNLLRVIVSLERLNHKFFVTADVCGIVKVWPATSKPSPVVTMDLEQAMAYNCMIELRGVLPEDQLLEHSALIACALKNQRVHIVLVSPLAKEYQILRSIENLSKKPTSIVQISPRHLAIAVGSLRERALIEIHDIKFTSHAIEPVATLSHHEDMIDSLIRIDLPVQSGSSRSKVPMQSPNVQWLVSVSRDRQLTLWKLYDGLPMRRTKANLTNAAQRQRQGSRLLISERMSAEDYVRNRSFGRHKQDYKHDDISSDEEENSPLRMKKHATHDVTNPHQNLQRNVSGMGNIEEESKIQHYVGEDQQNESEIDSSEERQHKDNEEDEELLDYFFTVDSSHKDFVRSMIQTNNGSNIITASEDKSIRIFTINTGSDTRC